MKEELIKELVASSKFTNRVNFQYQQKIELLQKEKSQYADEVNELKSQLMHLSQMSPTGSEKISSKTETKTETKAEAKTETKVESKTET